MVGASLSEIFSSIQGEGLESGSEALFIRFGGCNLACAYCDTLHARRETVSFHVGAGTSRETHGNPAAIREILSVIARCFHLPDTVVLTGGEPLLQPEAVGELAEALRMKGCRIHLETNGTLPEAFEKVRHLVDSVCMDIKIPSSLGGASYWEEHIEFLRLLTGMAGSVKVVLTEDVSDTELDTAAGLVARVNPFLPMLLQPASAGGRMAVSGGKLLRFRARAARTLRDVRISIQLHKVINVP